MGRLLKEVQSVKDTVPMLLCNLITTFGCNSVVWYQKVELNSAVC